MSAFQKIASQYLENLDSIPQEYIQKGYDFIQEYCQENDLKITDFVKDPENIPQISQAIHKSLSWGVKLLIKPADIESVITQNHSWIITKFEDIYQESKVNNKSLKA